MAGSYNFFLVGLSLLMAIAASLTALDLVARVPAAASRTAGLLWLGAASLAMGGGIWAMHFVAMLALSMPGMEARYDPWLTGLSLALAIIATGSAFFLMNRPRRGPLALPLGSLAMGLGISAMHYTGMAAMSLPMTVHYDGAWVVISILIAIAAAFAALALAFGGRHAPVHLAMAGPGATQGARRADAPSQSVGDLMRHDLTRLAAGVILGIAIAGMHFAGMRAADFHAGVNAGHAPTMGVDHSPLALGVTAVTFVILFAAMIAAMVDRRVAVKAARDAEALRASEAQFRLFYRATPLPLHALDAQGRIEEVSDAWLELLGHGRDAVIGQPLTRFMTGESARRRVQEDWPRLLDSGSLANRDYAFITRDGQVLDVVSTSRVHRDSAGRFVWAVGGLIDVTARKRVEEALRQAQKMEAIGQLTGGIAHDFNNLLAVVTGNLELLRRRIGGDPQSERLLDHAMNGARRGAALTQRMLAFARRQSLRPEAVSLPALIDGMEDLILTSLGDRMRLRRDLPADLPLVEVDGPQLELALLNLAVNARDASGAEGEIVLTARAVASGDPSLPAGLPEGRYVCLGLRDEGEGMDAETLSRVCEPFFTTKEVGKGTGLGLSMVHGFAEQSGGKLVLKSRKGEGTTAEIWLPVALDGAQEAAQQGAQGQAKTLPAAPQGDSIRPSAVSDAPGQPAEEEGAPAVPVVTLPSGPLSAQGPTAPAGDAPVRPLTILAVDDDALVLMNTEAILEDLGHHVLVAHRGREALDILARTPEIDLLVTDQSMPGMTGLELASAARAARPDLPILIATGYGDLPALMPSMARLGKPFLQADLARAIAGLLPAPGQSAPHAAA
ncbi:hypothetical protein BJF92_14995 [Rhizobium rhizosphaerae]|uniref:histidine kinase n=1 Tax=Xaviernesmea rhizosphaerae TaxID=1672749 RepID=A0A1Q9ACS6_9HYPH|nr:MHYT domain-containing protein [Xaviernesmea rhizosphaerae]OLP52707.1 hypothetical protein BJF92_14995 [Xaviernesmea rhizosphaerae]